MLFILRSVTREEGFRKFVGPSNGPSNSILIYVLKSSLLTKVFSTVKQKLFE